MKNIALFVERFYDFIATEINGFLHLRQGLVGFIPDTLCSYEQTVVGDELDGFVKDFDKN